MGPSRLHGGEDVSRLHNLLITSITPFDAVRISLLEDGDRLLIDDKLPILSLVSAIEFAMCGVKLEQLDHVVEVIDGTISTLPDAEEKAALATRHPI